MSVFLNTFRPLRVIHDNDGAHVHSSLLTIVLPASPLMVADLGGDAESICLCHQFFRNEQF